ncbi:MAG: DUF3467 domain-containing protein [archaeon]
MPAQEIRVDVDDGEAFAADEVSVVHNPLRLVLDFKSVTPRLDLRQQGMRLRVRHNVILIEPHLAKDFLTALKKNIDNFEKRFGKIKRPDSVEIANKENKAAAKTAVVTEKQDYFG